MDLFSSLICFSSSFILDVIWALYVRRTASGNVLASSLLAGLIMGFGAINTIYFVQNHWNILFSVIGAIVGTWVTLKIETDAQKIIDSNKG